jgi:hypothetical protein
VLLMLLMKTVALILSLLPEAGTINAVDAVAIAAAIILLPS